MTKAEQIVYDAAAGLFQWPQPPADWRQIKLCDAFSKKDDWDIYNTALCNALTAAGCLTAQGILDPFWGNCKLVSDLITFISQRCGF